MTDKALLALDKDESLLWEGKPDPSKLFSKQDAVCVPFSILFCGMLFIMIPLWKLPVVFQSLNDQFPSIAARLLLGGIFTFFIVQSYYSLFGRFIYKYWLLKRTQYFVTSKRVIVIQGKRILDQPFSEMNCIYKEKNTIYFSPPLDVFSGVQIYWELLGYYRMQQGLRMFFQNIESIDEVFALVCELKEQGGSHREGV